MQPLAAENDSSEPAPPANGPTAARAGAREPFIACFLRGAGRPDEFADESWAAAVAPFCPARTREEEA